MALTKPSFAQINTTESGLTDPLTVFNKNGTSADQDVGFILNRDGGATANVAIIWDETNDQFALVTTTDSGATDANINIASYSDLKVGTLIATDTTGGIAEFAAINDTPIGNATPSTGAFTTLDASGLINTTANISGAVVNAGSVKADQVNSTGNVVAQGAVLNAVTVNGNVTASYFTGDGSGLTNVGGTAIPENLNATGNILASGAIFNTLTVNGDADFTGTVTAGQFNTAGNILASGGVINTLAVNTTLNAVSINATGLINTIGNVSAVVLRGGELGVTGTSTLQNVNSSGYVNVTGNVSASVGNFGTGNFGTVNATGNILAQGAVVGDLSINNSVDLNGNVDIGDNNFIRIGDGPDLLIYHDGTDSYFDDVGTGSIFLRSGTTYVQNATGTKTSIATNSGAGQSIYFNNSLKFVTTDTGVGVTGEVDASGAISGTTGSFTGNVSAANYTGDGSALTNIQATTVTATANNTNSETVYLTFVDGATGSQGIETDTNLTYNPNSNVLQTTASSAQYADLAERYTADQDYEAGTVVVFSDKDSEFELTESTTSHDRTVAGVISTNPAYLMNSTTEGVALALQGRVPCKVLGPIQRGDLVVTSNTPGTAQRLDDSSYLPGVVIGKALGTIEDDSVQTIEVVVGRL